MSQEDPIPTSPLSSMVGGGCHQTYIIYHMAHAKTQYQYADLSMDGW